MYLKSISEESLSELRPVGPTEARRSLLIEDDIEEIKEGIQAHGEPHLEVDIGRHCKS